MKFHLLHSIPFAAAAALSFAALPLLAGPPLGHGGGGGGGAHSGAVHSGGGGPAIFNGGGGGHVSAGGVRVVVHNGGAGSRVSQPISHGGPATRGGPRYYGRGFVAPGPYVYGGGAYAVPYDADNGDSGGYPYSDSDTSASDARTVYPSGASTTVPNMAVSVQVALANAGYYNGTIDGVIGPGSMAAISAFQRTHGLPVTGLVDIYLLHSLGLYP
jgi:Putative peptidoglycan binding domain